MDVPFAVEVRRGRVGDLLQAGPQRDVGESPTVSLLVPEGSAIVLGSTQPREALRPDPGVMVVRRRSGGSAVWVDESLVWIDVTIPRTHAAWDDDLSRAGVRLGRRWVKALIACGASAASDGANTDPLTWTVHETAMRRTVWSSLVCFAGLGPGEVQAGGRKVVGISQRRTRDWALFQCAAVRRWNPEPLVAALALADADRSVALAELADAAIGLTLPAGEELALHLCAALNEEGW